MRIALVTFALWTLVVEPAVGAYERFEPPASQRERPGNDVRCDLDQPVPPGEVAAPYWQNRHALNVLAVPLRDAGGLNLPLDLPASTVSPVPLPAELCTPYPPSALPLRF